MRIAERDAELARADLELIDVAAGRAEAHVLKPLVGIDVEVVGIDVELKLALDAALAVIEGLYRLESDLPGHAAFDHAGRLRLVDSNLVEQFGRKLAEVDRPVAAAVGCDPPVDHGGTEERAQAADGDFGGAALFAVRAGAGQGFQRLADR